MDYRLMVVSKLGGLRNPRFLAFLALTFVAVACTPAEESGPTAAPNDSFNFLVIDRCSSIRPMSPEDNFTDIDGVPTETDHAVILGVTMGSETPTGTEFRVRFAREPSAELQQVGTAIVGRDKKFLISFAIDIPGQYLMTVGRGTAPNGARGNGAQNFVFEAPDGAAVCDKSTLGETARTTTVP